MAVIVVSSEEEELTTLADSIVVFRLGACDGVTYPKTGISAKQLRELAWVEPDAA